MRNDTMWCTDMMKWGGGIPTSLETQQQVHVEWSL